MIKGKPGNQMSYRMKKFLAKDINVMYKYTITIISTSEITNNIVLLPGVIQKC